MLLLLLSILLLVLLLMLLLEAPVLVVLAAAPLVLVGLLVFRMHVGSAGELANSIAKRITYLFRWSNHKL